MTIRAAYVLLWVLMFFLQLDIAVHAQSLPLGNCNSEPQLSGRNDIVFCEPWESETWWQDHGYVRDGGKRPAGPVDPVKHLDYASITTEGCVSGKCLKLLAKKDATRSLSVHWPLNAAGLQPESLYFRYYIKLGPNWTPDQCDADGNIVWPGSGKFPGLADVRVNQDASGQCGNGGASGDGVNCWSARGVFGACSDTGGASKGFPYDNTCDFVPGSIVRIGSYLYHYGQANSTGSPGFFDFVPERAEMGDDYTSTCRRGDPNNLDPQCYCNSPNNVFCGQGSGGMLIPNRWYAVEVYIAMNTPGQANGVLRGWVDGKLSYDKRNMEYRIPGHDNLHVRTVWLNVYKGGTKGNCNDSYIYLDNMVVAQNGPIGPRDDTPPPMPVDTLPPAAPDNVQVEMR